MLGLLACIYTMVPEPRSVVGKLPWIIAFVFLAAIEWAAIYEQDRRQEKLDTMLRLKNTALELSASIMAFAYNRAQTPKSDPMADESNIPGFSLITSEFHRVLAQDRETSQMYIDIYAARVKQLVEDCLNGKFIDSLPDVFFVETPDRRLISEALKDLALSLDAQK
jgi:hypothetical protein